MRRSVREERSRIPSLDGLRAVSITFVIIAHLTTRPGVFIPFDYAGRWLMILGGLGVRVFFVISGFLITSLLLTELGRRGTIHLPKFYFRRGLRIFVPYYACVAMLIVLQLPGLVSLTPGDILHAVTYTMNYYPERSWDVGHAWSLSVEEQFYILWPAALLLLGRLRGLWLAAAFLVLAPISRISYFYFLPELVPDEVAYRFETVSDALATGCLLAGLSNWLGRQGAYRRFISSRLFIVMPLVVLCGATLEPRLRLYYLLGISLENVGIAACIAWCVANFRSRIGRLLNSRPLVMLGLMSYSVYLWQQPFTNYSSNSPIARFPLNVLLLAAATVASFYLVERPALMWRYRLEGRLFGPREGSRERVATAPPLEQVKSARLGQQGARVIWKYVTTICRLSPGDPGA
jgi:peptidoglycan/LPS O-acetylase OafA/YrhL